MRNVVLALVLIAAIVTFVAPLPAASNAVQDGYALTLTWSGTSPTNGDPVVKSTVSATGGIVGVALNGTGTANEAVTVSTRGVYKLPVRAISSNITIGEWIYTSVTDATVGVASLTNVATGLKYGKALENLVTGSNTQDIKVLIVQP